MQADCICSRWNIEHCYIIARGWGGKGPIDTISVMPLPFLISPTGVLSYFGVTSFVALEENSMEATAIIESYLGLLKELTIFRITTTSTARRSPGISLRRL